MSILQEYERIKKDVGEEKWNAIDKFIETQRPDLRLDEIIYNSENWRSFEKWFYERDGISIDVNDVWLFQDNEYKANATIGIYGESLGEVVLSCAEKNIRNLTANIRNELTIAELKNAFAIFGLRDFKSLANLPKISEVSDLLREIYDSVKFSDSNMCFITYNDWKECFAEDYSDKDFERLKEEVKKYNLYNVITFDEDDCKIVGYEGLEALFIDDRKEPVKEITTLEFLNDEKEMIEHNLMCYSEGNFINKAKKGYEKEFNRESQKLVVINKLIDEEKQKIRKKENMER